MDAQCIDDYTYISRYAVVVHSINVVGKNFEVEYLIGSHKPGERNDKVELLQFHNGTMFCLVNGLGSFFPNLKSIFIGYSDSDSDSLNTKFIIRSNFENMENLFEIVVHKSDIEMISEDLLWDLPNLERFQLDGKLEELPERTFEKNVKLKEVYLASNQLEYLPRQLFKNNLFLDWVNFKDNFLKIIEIDFIRLENIRYIFLAGNICINSNFNKSEEIIESRNENQTENANLYQERKIVELQRLIYSNCSYIP